MKLVTLFFVISCAFAAQAKEFKGYPCKSECEGHKAGYAWAQEKQVEEKFECFSDSRSFTEGCYAYIDDQSLFSRFLKFFTG